MPIPSGPIDPGMFSNLVDGLKKRFHNMPEDMRRKAMAEAMEETVGALFDEVTAKSHHYVAGANLLKSPARSDDSPDGEPHGRNELAFFNTMSLGNWLELCHGAGIATVPARLAGVMRPLAAFALATGKPDDLIDEDRLALSAISAALGSAAPGDILRWDAGMGELVKVCAQASLAPIGDARGWRETDDGHRLPVFGGERLANMFLAWPDPNPHNGMPCWIRPWVDARRVPAIAPDGESIVTPIEWRVYVRDNEPVAVSSFYPSLAEELSERDLVEIAMALDATREIIRVMQAACLVPHHPRYEKRSDLDPCDIHFSIDFLALPGEEPGIVMLEAGPAHLREPHFGAHPCCFGLETVPQGIAHGLVIDQNVDLARISMSRPLRDVTACADPATDFPDANEANPAGPDDEGPTLG